MNAIFTTFYCVLFSKRVTKWVHSIFPYGPRAMQHILRLTFYVEEKNQSFSNISETDLVSVRFPGPPLEPLNKSLICFTLTETSFFIFPDRSSHLMVYRRPLLWFSHSCMPGWANPVVGGWNLLPWLPAHWDEPAQKATARSRTVRAHRVNPDAYAFQTFINAALQYDVNVLISVTAFCSKVGLYAGCIAEV